LIRMSGVGIFSADIQGAARTELDTMLAQIAIYFAAAGAALSVTMNPGAGARANLQLILQDLADMLAGGTGIVTFPDAAAPANGVSMAEVIRFISDSGRVSTVYTATASAVSSLTCAALADIAANYIGQMAVPLAGNMQGQGRAITDYDGTQVLTVEPAWAQAPGNVTFAILPTQGALLARSRQGLAYYGSVTTATSTTAFTDTKLAGLPVNMFIGWWVTVLQDIGGGVGGAPQNEWRQISASTVLGAITHAAFTAQTAVGDTVLLVHPILYKIMQAMPGAASLETINIDQQTLLDYAEVRTLASPVTLTAVVQYIYSDSPGRPFHFTGGFINRATGAWATAESVTITVQVMIDAVNWVTIWTITFAAEPAPVTVAIPSHANSALLNLPYGFWNNGGGVRVGIVQTVVGAGYHTWNHSFIDGVPSS